jgi:glycosyltransferase involved in cell wall biosynthesis
MKRKKRILFAKLGHFSYTNDEVTTQIVKNFPDHDLIVADVKDLVKPSYFSSGYNILTEVATFGPSVLTNRSDFHAFFFRTPFMFRRLNQMLVEAFGGLTSELDFVMQTQGLFDARIPGTPILIYTDYTFLSTLDLPGHDKRQFRSKKSMRYEADLYRRADAIAVTGSHVERTLVEQYGCDPSRVQTAHIGANVAVPAVSTDLARYAAKHVVFVGVEWERKGGPALLEGFRRASKDHPDARLTIIGCSPDVSGPGVTVVGSIPRTQMPRFYEAASMFCMPSLIEPLGIAAVEASLFRLLVVATRIDGFFETVTDEQTGILVPVNDPTAIASALGRLFADPGRAQRMGAAGFERNHARFNWDEVGKRLRTLAETMVPRLREAA